MPKARRESTAGTYIWLPTIPLVPGWAPVASVAALTRVTVGNTAWLFVKATPSVRRRWSVGVSSQGDGVGAEPVDHEDDDEAARYRHGGAGRAFAID